MRKTLGGCALAAIAGLGALATVAGTAHAAPTEATSLYAPSSLVLSVTDGDSAQATVTRAVTLTCRPTAGGDHPAPRAACAELQAARGTFAELTDLTTGSVCTREYAPVTVVAQGVWEGRNVSYSHTFANSCLQQSARGTLFHF
ncbi:subtilase-type protease inhibitor [Streptomyces sp. HSW2009]|uniref:subtilase-type protease inhibitor n=1 Tax=Streptomyces sp. HSW2009 TaxID=3142890 RepID=UPI0032F06036